jgi:GH15 family glucan-1,4-alpha-glucosidase
VPWLGFPIEKPVVRRTVDAVVQALRAGDYLLRYRGDDGLRDQDGASLMSSFWLVDALLLLERAGEAEALFDRLLERANDLGLFAEEIDPESHAFLGNFPQAVVHLAVISTAIRLQLHRKGGLSAIARSGGTRPRGWLRQALRTGRLFSSRRSILALG